MFNSIVVNVRVRNATMQKDSSILHIYGILHEIKNILNWFYAKLMNVLLNLKRFVLFWLHNKSSSFFHFLEIIILSLVFPRYLYYDKLLNFAIERNKKCAFATDIWR